MQTLTLPEPPSANRWWRKFRNRMVLSPEARAYKENVAQLAGHYHIEQGEIRVSIDWYRQRRSGDLDKRVGVALDALQGVLFANDSQIVELHTRRFDDPKKPRIVVTVEKV